MAAWHYLKEQGYELLSKNYRCSYGEIDVIALREKVISFVEIKTRRHHYLGAPEEAVDLRKQKKIAQVAQYYLKQTNQSDAASAFDVLAITWKEGSLPEFKLIKDAFIMEPYV